MSYKNQFICLKGTLLLSFMLLLQVCNAQSNFTDITKLLEKNKIELGKNFVCLVYKDGKVVYKKEQEEFDSKVQAPIGITSQWLTTALVMAMVDAGKITLDDKVSRYLPILAKYGKSYITIRQCLQHQTGIEAEQGIMKMFDKTKFETLEEEANYFASKRDIIANPGIEFRFSNVGINLVARVIEVVGKKGYDQLMNEKVFRPLMMRTSNMASNGDRQNPAGGGISTGVEMINFLSMILNKGMFNGKRVLSEKSITEMETLLVEKTTLKFIPNGLEKYEYGLGCLIQKNAKEIATTIAYPNLYGSFFWIDRCHNYAAVILTKNLQGEDKKGFFENIKSGIDGVVGGCIEQ